MIDFNRVVDRNATLVPRRGPRRQPVRARVHTHLSRYVRGQVIACVVPHDVRHRLWITACAWHPVAS